MHSAAVYSIALIHSPLENMLHILTCSFDGYVRLWKCDVTNKACKINQEIFIGDASRSAKKIYPTACAVVENSFFIVGDSIG